MRLGGRRTSSNIERQTGGGGSGFGIPGLGRGGGIPIPIGGKGGLGCGTIALIVIVYFAFQFFGGGMAGSGGGPVQTTSADNGQVIQNDTDRLVAQVLASTEDRWTEIFRENGQIYQPATLVFYDRNGQSGCGAASSAMGPFYCPSDQKVYLDTSFFDELRQRFGAPGDFAQAYVVAHEIGHHIQYLDGTADRVRQEQERAGRTGGNELQVRMELQADCYAGVWASREEAMNDLLETGDIEEGMRAAQAIGDDTLQRQAQGYVVPESFTHGTSEQRQSWLRRGIETGDPASCDTFSARTL